MMDLAECHLSFVSNCFVFYLLSLFTPSAWWTETSRSPDIDFISRWRPRPPTTAILPCGTSKVRIFICSYVKRALYNAECLRLKKSPFVESKMIPCKLPSLSFLIWWIISLHTLRAVVVYRRSLNGLWPAWGVRKFEFICASENTNTRRKKAL